MATNKQIKTGVKMPNLDKISKLDSCFRDPNPEHCTLDEIIRKFEDDPKFGTISKSMLYDYIKRFRIDFGAEFKGTERDDEIGTFSYARFGRESYYQYKDLNAPLPLLHERISQYKQDSGIALLNVLKMEENNGLSTPMHIWLRLFLDQMLNDRATELDVVSFYENKDLFDENRTKFEALLKAILDKQPLLINYAYGKRNCVKIHPYRLKNYNQRWYLIGKRWNDDMRPTHPGRYYEGYACLALNGIQDGVAENGAPIPAIQNWDIEYLEPDNNDLNDYFEDMVGVTPSANGPEDVYLRFSKNRYEKYVATKPIVGTQSHKPVNEDSPYYNPDRPTIRIKAHITKELEQQILSFGEDCEVVAPETLRQTIATKIQAMQCLYS